LCERVRDHCSSLAYISPFHLMVSLEARWMMNAWKFWIDAVPKWCDSAHATPQLKR
jgi:hypothetical protein